MIKIKIINVRFSQPHVEIVAYAHLFTRHAFVSSPFSESPQHLNQNFCSSFFKDEGFLPAKEAPGMSFPVRMLFSVNEELDDAMISLLLTFPRTFQPRFHVLESRPFRVAAIYEYGVYLKQIITLNQAEVWVSVIASSCGIIERISSHHQATCVETKAGFFPFI